MKRNYFLALLLMASCTVTAQTFTMSKKCKVLIDSANVLLKDKDFQPALDAFVAMEKSCSTKDAKEATAVGKAEAYNGLGQYDEAIKASDAALKLTKNKSLNGFFQKAIAQNKTGQVEASKATFANVIALTEKNQDTKAKASNYALLAVLHDRQLHERDSAFFFLDKAIALDPENADFYIQKGDMLVVDKNYDDAFVQYDKAVEKGRTDIDMYEIRAIARMKMVQEKYNTTNTQELRSKMNATEKEQVCRELKKALALGLRNMQYDMFSSMVCK
jgi:tetratricopeptide (TPR) repeat protein